MLFKLLNGAASPANCARKIPGPLIVLMAPSTPPSIYDEVLRRAFFRPVRSQEQRHVRDVTRKHTRLQTLPGHNFLFELRRIPQFYLPLGPNSPGRNRVDPYAEGAKFTSHNPRQPGDRRLDHVIYRQTSVLEPPNHRTEVDNRATPQSFHLRRDGLRREEHMPQVHRDPLIPVRRCHLVHRVPVVVPRIIDEDSNVAQLRPDFFDSSLQRGNVPEVAVDEERRRSRLLPNLSDQRPARFLRNIHERNARPLFGDAARVRRTNPAPPTGNKHRFVSEAGVARRSACIHISQPPRLRRETLLYSFSISKQISGANCTSPPSVIPSAARDLLFYSFRSPGPAHRENGIPNELKGIER